MDPCRSQIIRNWLLEVGRKREDMKGSENLGAASLRNFKKIKTHLKNVDQGFPLDSGISQLDL